MNSSDENKPTHEEGDDIGSGPGNLTPAAQPTDIEQNQGITDADFIPKFSQVQSRHAESGSEKGSETSEETAQEQASSSPAPSPAANNQNAPKSANLADMSLAIEMLAVASFDDLKPVVSDKTHSTTIEVESFEAPPEAPLHKPADAIVDFSFEKTSYNFSSEEEAESFIESIESAVDELVLKDHAQEETTALMQSANSEIPRPGETVPNHSVSSESSSAHIPVPGEVVPQPDPSAEMQSLGFHRDVVEPRYEKPSPLPVVRPGEYLGDETFDLDDILSGKKRSNLLRRSMFWVVKEARLVTHGAFSDFTPSDPNNTLGDKAWLEDDAEEFNKMPSSFDGGNLSTGGKLTDSSSDIPSIVSASASAMPIAPGPVEVPQPVAPAAQKETGSARPYLIDPASPNQHHVAGDEAGTVFTDKKPASQSDKPSGSISPAVAPRPEKIAMSYRTGEHGKITPAEDHEAEPVVHEAAPEDEIDDTARQIKLPIFGFVDRDKLKKRAIMVVSVILLGVASGVVMYDTINSGKVSSGLQTPSKVEKKPSETTGGADTSATTALTPEQFEKAELAKALVCEQQKRYDESLEHFDNVLSKGKKDISAFHGRGRVLTKLERYDLAKSDLENALALAPRNQQILIDLAAVDYLVRDYDGAAKVYKRILGLNRKDVDALYGRGISYAALGKYREAIGDYEEVVRLKPTYERAYRQMCAAYLSLGHYDKAEGVISVALKACGPNEDLYFSRGLARYKLGLRNDAVEDYNNAIKLNHGRKEFFNDRGFVLMELGRYEDACQDFEKALEIDPQYKLAVDNLKHTRQILENKAPNPNQSTSQTPNPLGQTPAAN